jgi:hypothetical protein
MALAEDDLAILTARFGSARFGASRFGFIPCPEDVHGSGAQEPGEYIWKEVRPPTTTWTLLTENCVCGQSAVAPGLSVSVLAVMVESVGSGVAKVQFTYTITGGSGIYTYSLSWVGGGGGGPNTFLDPTITFTGTPLGFESISWNLDVLDDALLEGSTSGTVNVQYNQ